MSADRFLADPRPDLGDGRLWSALLAAAYALDGDDPAGLFGALHGLRSCGARAGATGRPSSGRGR